MKKTVLLFVFLLSINASFSRVAHANTAISRMAFDAIDFGKSTPDYNAFSNAVTGYEALKSEGKVKKEILSIIDFNLSSNKKRLWVLDMENKKLLFHTLVAHGRNSGDEFAKSFSNQEGSYQSSLGFYLTGNIYNGKHGNSLKLIGLERNINDAAFNRGIVIHGADYVSKDFIQQNGRLGRSLGCPAVPEEICSSLVNTIHSGSCLFIYKKDASYLSKTKLLSSL